MASFDVQGGVWLACARGAAVAGMLLVFGSVVFRVVVMARVGARLPEADARPIERRLLGLTLGGVVASLGAMLAWMLIQSVTMADAGSVQDAIAAVPAVALHTRFGHVALLQMAALAGAGGSLWLLGRRYRWWVGLAFACVALGLQAGHGHAASMYARPSLLLLWDVLHLAGAGAWLGGLVPLLVVVQGASPRIGASAARWFSPLGKLCIAALVVSAIGQSWVLVGSLSGFVGTAYGWMLLVKFVLFGVLLGFAAINRYRFAPALLGDFAVPAQRVLVRSIAVQSCVGLAIVVAAAVLSSLPPAMHEQTVWPFAWQFSLVTVREDAEFRNEVLAAALAVAAALVLLLIAILLRRRWSLLPAAGAVGIGWVAIPHLGLLLVPAYPTSYYHSPTGFASASIVAGAALYPAHCAACHGVDGRGDGAAGSGLAVAPADLTAAHVWMHSDGELFWWLAHGIAGPAGQLAMPGFADVLSDDERWALIDYIRGRNAGFAFQQAGAWPVPLRAPGLQANCANGRMVQLADLRGGFVRVVNGPATAMAGVVTIALDGRGAVGPGLCVSSDADAVQAYGIVAGLAPGRMAGAEFLIDGDGWLRAVQPAGARVGWDDPLVLASAIKGLRAHPVAGESVVAPMNMKM